MPCRGVGTGCSGRIGVGRRGLRRRYRKRSNTMRWWQHTGMATRALSQIASRDATTRELKLRQTSSSIGLRGGCHKQWSNIYGTHVQYWLQPASEKLEFCCEEQRATADTSCSSPRHKTWLCRHSHWKKIRGPEGQLLVGSCRRPIYYTSCCHHK